MKRERERERGVGEGIEGLKVHVGSVVSAKGSLLYMFATDR